MNKEEKYFIKEFTTEVANIDEMKNQKVPGDQAK